MKLLLIIYSLIFSLSASAQSDSMYVSGRMLYNNCKDTLVLHGINYPVLDDWDFPANMNTGSEKLSEIEKTGANCVRIQWYNNYRNVARSAYALKDLDSLLTRCARYKIIPIVGLWDLTSSGDWNRFPQIITNNTRTSFGYWLFTKLIQNK